MKDTERACHLIQEDIAWGRGLSQEDREHALSCGVCSEIVAQFEEIDALVDQVSGEEVPDRFADRIVAAIEKEQIRGGKFISKSFPSQEGILYSIFFQWTLMGIGVLFGLLKIFGFITGIWILTK